MESSVTRQFRAQLAALPARIRLKAQAAYRQWQQDPRHPSLHFKCINVTAAIYSVRIDRDWRAVAVVKDGHALWFWIGSHAEYDKLISRLR